MMVLVTGGPLESEDASRIGSTKTRIMFGWAPARSWRDNL